MPVPGSVTGSSWRFGTRRTSASAATHDELFAYLRQLPDTSMGTEQSRGLLLGGLGVVSVAARVGFGVSGIASRDERFSGGR